MNLIKRNGNLVFPSLLDEFLRPDWNGGVQNFKNTVPAVNIKENETDYKLEFYAPGLKKEDFTIEIEQQTLSISSEKQAEQEENNEKYSLKEFSLSSFKRTFSLPESVDFDAIAANYENGVLHVTLPKREEALQKSKRLIAIN
ncbi:Hsp20/alpha crystallin family protein [Flavobacterium sp. RSB2_4_14]|uniref:Hsp20/alpha crystallin family protein n=1 Tax=Flavobacterium sp. RSB2_4_14 TaxID=3447665 RepID=UPI003F34E3EB